MKEKVEDDGKPRFLVIFEKEGKIVPKFAKRQSEVKKTIVNIFEAAHNNPEFNPDVALFDMEKRKRVHFKTEVTMIPKFEVKLDGD